MIKVISSFSAEGYKLYGKDFLESYLKYWPVPIHVYIEGPKKQYPGLILDKNIIYYNLFEIPGCANTLDAMSKFPMMSGNIQGKNDYRFNIYRFARKIFAQCDAATKHDDLLFWLDADTVFTGKVTEEWLRDCFKESIRGKPFMVYMGRPSWHSCASFVGWDTTHDKNVPFWTKYFELITAGTFLMLPEWHDSFILDAIRGGLNVPSVNLSADVVGEGPVNVFDFVFKGKGRHFKGNLKFGPKRYGQLIDIVQQLQPKRIIEIGTWDGNRAIEMHRASPNLNYIGFDLFEDATPKTDQEEMNVKPHHEKVAVLHKLLKAGLAAELVKGNTNETFPKWASENPGFQADLIYIDGGHAVQTIQNDLDNALKVIKPGGTIVMDDWYEGGIDIEQFGCNRVLEYSKLPYEVLPIADPVKGGGSTKMVVIRL